MKLCTRLASFLVCLELAGCSDDGSNNDASETDSDPAVVEAPAVGGSDVGEESSLLKNEPDVERPAGMAWIPGGSFEMGSGDGFPDELPVHEVELDGFWMDTTEVTVAEFKRFADATGYKTIAERKPRREDFADQLTPAELAAIPEEKLVAGSICFNPKFNRSSFPKDRRPTPAEIYLVWKYEAGANWRHPNGPDSSISDRMDHPVTHVAWDDAVAYCEWAGKQLPSEAQWEYAARGGLDQKMYPWGDTREPDGRWMTNIWQGEWPFKNLVQDGHENTSPVMSFEPNAYGLFDMSGNVWEWCRDYYRPDYYQNSSYRNPLGPVDSLDPNEPNVPKRIQRGGSFMCNANYCTGYRVSARMKGDPMSGTWHCGFRCVVSAKAYDSYRKAPGAKSGSTSRSKPKAGPTAPGQ